MSANTMNCHTKLCYRRGEIRKNFKCDVRWKGISTRENLLKEKGFNVFYGMLMNFLVRFRGCDTVMHRWPRQASTSPS